MTQSSYATTSYSSANLQRQPAGKARTGLKRLTGQRLPWGNTQEVVPDSFMQPEPKSLRFWEQENKRKAELKAKGSYKPAPLEHIDFHDRCDHEHYRHAPWAARTHFWIYLATLGKGGFFLFIFLGIWVALFETFRADQNHFQAFFEAFSFLFYTVSLPCLLVWGLASLVIHKLPRLWAKPGKGPKWDLNRRTRHDYRLQVQGERGDRTSRALPRV